MPKQRKLSGAGAVLLNDFQAKAVKYGARVNETDEQTAQPEKDEMLKARYKLERYMILMNGYAGQFIRLREAVRRSSPRGHTHTDTCDPTNCDISPDEWLQRHTAATVAPPKSKCTRRR